MCWRGKTTNNFNKIPYGEREREREGKKNFEFNILFTPGLNEIQEVVDGEDFKILLERNHGMIGFISTKKKKSIVKRNP